ncbi:MULTISPECIES: restriction endonuclease [Marinomonas]|uniref:restriction endonuclease n=1 Tax=Marinomonas TaxID=28253 RepID=UPI0008374F88|nr:restriction endonuclease [Marinomonas atlantica]
MSSKNIVLVRSPQQLIKENLAGYGWGCIDFSSYSSASEIHTSLREDHNVNLGRHKKQIQRFFQIKEGDLVVVPIPRAIVLGIATGKKSFQEGINYGENQVEVAYFRDVDGKVIRIPRSKLSQGLESRLKIRFSIASLKDFQDEINDYVDQLKESGSVCFDTIFQQKLDDAVDTFKSALLDSLKNGQTNLKSGGNGLERLLKELLEIEGYTAHIEAKNKSSDISDIDISATRTDPVSSNRVFIQAKHHSGNTDRHGIKQLIAIDEQEHHDKWLITTGTVTEENRKYAEEHDIKVMDGKELVDWIYHRVDRLSSYTKEVLKIVLEPQHIL